MYAAAQGFSWFGREFGVLLRGVARVIGRSRERSNREDVGENMVSFVEEDELQLVGTIAIWVKDSTPSYTYNHRCW